MHEFMAHAFKGCHCGNLEGAVRFVTTTCEHVANQPACYSHGACTVLVDGWAAVAVQCVQVCVRLSVHVGVLGSVSVCARMCVPALCPCLRVCVCVCVCVCVRARVSTRACVCVRARMCVCVHNRGMKGREGKSTRDGV